MITLRQFLEESDRTKFLTLNETALAGHLSHLYEDDELTFG
jgi:hypothetical protein